MSNTIHSIFTGQLWLLCQHVSVPSHLAEPVSLVCGKPEHQQTHHDHHPHPQNQLHHIQTLRGKETRQRGLINLTMKEQINRVKTNYSLCFSCCCPVCHRVQAHNLELEGFHSHTRPQVALAQLHRAPLIPEKDRAVDVKCSLLHYVPFAV